MSLKSGVEKLIMLTVDPFGVGDRHKQLAKAGPQTSEPQPPPKEVPAQQPVAASQPPTESPTPIEPAVPFWKQPLSHEGRQLWFILAVLPSALTFAYLAASAHGPVDQTPMPPPDKVCDVGPVEFIYAAEIDQILNRPNDSQVRAIVEVLTRYPNVKAEHLEATIRANKVPEELIANRTGDCTTIVFELNPEYAQKVALNTH